MGFSKSLFAGLSLVAYAIAQNAPVAFTSVPAVVVGGSSYNLTWAGGDGTPVTLTLRKGDPSDLDTIGVLADSVEGNSYLWKVSESLQSGTDYALQITQGQADINYSGQFTVTQGTSSSTASSAAATAAASSNSTMTSSPSALTTLGASNSTTSANATVTSSYTGRTITTTPATSVHSTTTHTAATAAVSTIAPNSNVAAQFGSSAAFVVGIVGAVMCLN